MNHPVFPFSAIVGQERLKTSLLLNAVDPKLGGLLVTGPKGSGKSTIIRALEELLPPIERVKGCKFNCNPKDNSNLCPSCKNKLINEKALPIEVARTRIIQLPLSATEDRLLGTLDVEKAFKEGIKTVMPGVLAEANQNVLYLDEANLLPDYLVDCILDPVASGWNIVQREGLSLTHPSRFTLFASMNPEEGELRPQIMDRFALSVSMESINDSNMRSEIVRRNLSFEEDPITFRELYKSEQLFLREKIIRAREILSKVKVSNEILNAISETCTKLKIDGYRPDLALVKASRAYAALEGRNIVEAEDIVKVSQFVLGHRTRGEGHEQIKKQVIEDNFRNILFKEVPKKPENMVSQPPAPSEDIISDNLQSPKPNVIRIKKRQREIPVILQQAISIVLIFLLLFSISVGVLLFKGIFSHVPIQSALTLDQILITMGISAIILTCLIFLFPGETRQRAVFFYQSLGTGFHRRIVQVQHQREYPDEMNVEDQKDKEAQYSRFHHIINVPLYASFDRLYKLVLNRGPKLLGKGNQIKERKYKFSLERRREKKFKGNVGRNAKTESPSQRGRYVSYEFPKRRPWDIALGPTLRAAAPYQVFRKAEKLPLIIKTEDVRVKVRETQSALTMVILLDMSESMAVSLKNIRNAILNMHDIAYKKRDRIGLIVFKGSSTSILQTPTANLNLIVEKLKNIGASDLTPLAAGMFQSWRLLRNEKIRNKNIIPVLVIISDGIANIPLTSPLSPFTRNKYLNHAQADVIDAAFLLQREGIQILIINPSHVQVGEGHSYIYKTEIMEKMGKQWLDPTELLMQIPVITGGYYYGIGEGGELESIILNEALGIFNK